MADMLIQQELFNFSQRGTTLLVVTLWAPVEVISSYSTHTMYSVFSISD